MERDRILGILRAHAPELQAAGLLHLRLFGSMARGDNTPESDVDLLFDYDEANSLNLLSAYGLEDRVSQILGARAHLSSSKHLRANFRERGLQEAVRAY